MKVGDLFAGIGGFSLGLEWAGMETVWQVERDEFCQKVLKKHWPNVKRYGDIHGFLHEVERGTVEPVDLIAGGPPCQPASVAGKRRGAADDRWLWPEALRAVAALRPAWCLFENPLGLRSMGLDDVLSELEGMGYTAVPLVIPAAAVGAPHRRDRIWIIASSDASTHSVSHRVRELGERIGEQYQEQGEAELGHDSQAESLGNTSGSRWREGREVECVSCKKREQMPCAGGQALADTGRSRLEKRKRLEPEATERERPCSAVAPPFWWSVEPDVGRVAHGIPRRLDRLRALGNAVVPQIPYIIGQAIMEVES